MIHVTSERCKMGKNLIFITMARLVDISRRGIYTDLLRKFRSEGWNIYIVTPHERSIGLPTELINLNDNLNDNVSDNGKVGDVYALGVRTLNLQKTSTIEKGIGQVLVEGQYKRAIKRYLPDVKFDLILYSTPPITFPKVIAYLKKRNPQAMSYLLLKDIFPQNAVDIGMMSKTGVKGVLYRFFRRKEKKLYALSDYIGCMSPANVEYVLKHNPELNDNDNLNLNHNDNDNDNLNVNRVEVAPNSVSVNVNVNVELNRDAIRIKYGIPTDRPVFIYGGNLGKPQGIPFLIECLEANSTRDDCHFLVIGTGTELPKLKAWYNDNVNHNANFNVTVMEGLPKAEYDELVRSCDVGLIFLDHRFTIPNFPSRLLSYLENKMPVLCATDSNTDMGRIAEENGFGFWCESNSVEAFTAILDRMISADRTAMGEKGFAFLKENYLVENTYNAIVSHLA